MGGIMATYIGIDIGKKSLEIYFPAIAKSFSVTNDESGFSKLLTCLNKNYQSLSEVIIVFEPTGGYEKCLRNFLKSYQLNFTTVHPNKVRGYAKAKGLLAKTDELDSKLLHDYANCFSLPVKSEYNTENQETLHNLIKRREQLIFFQNQEIARLDTADDPLLEKSLTDHLSYLELELEQINKTIENLCHTDPDIKSKIDRLTSIPGVGITLATNVICKIPQLGYCQFNNLTSLVGLAPFAKESGQYKGKRSIFAGKNSLRKVLYMAAVASLRCNKKLKAFYERLISNHKPPKVALVAVMRKLLSFMNAVIKNNSFWNNNYAVS